MILKFGMNAKVVFPFGESIMAGQVRGWYVHPKTKLIHAIVFVNETNWCDVLESNLDSYHSPSKGQGRASNPQGYVSTFR